MVAFSILTGISSNNHCIRSWNLKMVQISRIDDTIESFVLGCLGCHASRNIGHWFRLRNIRSFTFGWILFAQEEIAIQYIRPTSIKITCSLQIHDFIIRSISFRSIRGWVLSKWFPHSNVFTCNSFKTFTCINYFWSYKFLSNIS